MSDSVDVIIVGAGPAGLTAATYLGRFKRTVVVLDGQSSRASKIPLSHNYPGFPEGIAGPELLARMREQAQRYGARIEPAWVDAIETEGDVFVAHSAAGTWRGRKLLLCTGVEDIDLEYPEAPEAVQTGRLRYCPICDGYEICDKRVAVIANSSAGVKEAIYLRHFTDRLTVVPASAATVFSEDDKSMMRQANIGWAESPLAGLLLTPRKVDVEYAEGDEDLFDSLYCALGTRVSAELAVKLGAQCDEAGYVVTDAHQQTSVPGVYAAGDVSQSINQIAVATGEAAIAASAIHRSLNQ